MRKFKDLILEVELDSRQLVSRFKLKKFDAFPPSDPSSKIINSTFGLISKCFFRYGKFDTLPL